jgi:HPt (histidine-containing phosphotransfer) domain-containing protein
MEDLRARFLARFIESGHERSRRATAACAQRLDLAAGELHALAGEAALLGFAEIDALARRGERAARQKAVDECARILGEIDLALAALSRG